MNAAEEAVNIGLDLTKEVSNSFSQIAEDIQSINEMASESAAKSEEQAQAIEIINNTMEEISTVSNQYAAGTGQVAQAVEELNTLQVTFKK